MFIEILFKILLFKGGVLIYAEHCISCCYIYIYIFFFLHTQIQMFTLHTCNGGNKNNGFIVNKTHLTISYGCVFFINNIICVSNITINT